MGGFTDDGYEARTVEELFQIYVNTVDAEYGDTLEEYPGSFNRALFRGFSRAVAKNQEEDLENLYSSIFVELADGEELTDLARQYGVDRQPAVAATGVVEWSRNDTTTETVVQENVPVETEAPESIRFKTTETSTFLGPESLVDDTDYTTSSTSFVTETSFTIDVDFRDSLDVEADYDTTNSSYTAYIEIADATNNTTIVSDSTTSTSTVTVGPTTYDTSSLSGDITIEFRIRIGNSSGTAELLRSAVDVPGQYATRSNIIAQEAGNNGNVGADRITEMPNPPAGVTAVTNPFPTGDPNYTLTDGSTQLVLGQNREDDESVKERVLEGGSIGGSATVRAVRDAIRALDGTPSLTIYVNRTTTDNANGNGLPKLSTELVIHSPSVTDQDVANAIHYITAVTARLTSGHNGTTKTYDIDEEVLNSTRTVEWSEPAEVTLEITVDAVTESGYPGDSVVKDSIARYIGGTLTDGSRIAGLDVSGDVIVDELERRVNSIDGVIGVASVTIDADGDGTDDTTTRADGLQAYETASNVVATVDASSDITVTT